MERHPCLVDRDNILTARRGSAYSAAREEVPERQSTPQSRRLELSKNASHAKCSFDRPAGARGSSSDDRVEIQEMDRHRLNRLRRGAPVMLHAIRVTPDRIDKGC